MRNRFEPFKCTGLSEFWLNFSFKIMEGSDLVSNHDGRCVLHVRATGLKVNHPLIKDKSTLCVCINPKRVYWMNPFVVRNSQAAYMTHDWHFYYKGNCSFQITLFKKRKMRGNLELGHVLLSTRSFPPDDVRTVKAELKDENSKVISEITLTVHRCENGEAAFQAENV